MHLKHISILLVSISIFFISFYQRGYAENFSKIQTENLATAITKKTMPSLGRQILNANNGDFTNYMDTLPDEIIQIVHQFDTFATFDNWFQSIFENIEKGKIPSKDMLPYIEILAYLFGYESAPDKYKRKPFEMEAISGIEYSYASIIKNLSLNTDEKTFLRSIFYEAENYESRKQPVGFANPGQFNKITRPNSLREEFVSKLRQDILVWVWEKAIEELSTDDGTDLLRERIEVFARVKQYKSLALKLERALYFLKGVPFREKNMRSVAKYIRSKMKFKLKEYYRDTKLERWTALAGQAFKEEKQLLEAIEQGTLALEVSGDTHEDAIQDHTNIQDPNFITITIHKDGNSTEIQIPRLKIPDSEPFVRKTFEYEPGYDIAEEPDSLNYSDTRLLKARLRTHKKNIFRGNSLLKRRKNAFMKDYNKVYLPQLRGLLEELDTIDNLQHLSIQEQVNLFLKYPAVMKYNCLDFLDDLIGLNVVIDDTGFSEAERNFIMMITANNIERILRLPYENVQVFDERKISRAKNYQSTNLYLTGVLQHKLLGNLPSKIQIRFKRALYHESVMYYPYKLTDRWEYPEWAKDINIDQMSSFQELQEVLFEEFKRYSEKRFQFIAKFSSFELQNFYKSPEDLFFRPFNRSA